jgi:hypothetical protein
MDWVVMGRELAKETEILGEKKTGRNTTLFTINPTMMGRRRLSYGTVRGTFILLIY